MRLSEIYSTEHRKQIQTNVVFEGEIKPIISFEVFPPKSQNTKLFEVLLPYLIQLKKQGKDPNKSVKRRVLRVRHLISSLVIQGVKSQEFKNVNIHATGELLYGLVESSIFRISVLNQKNVDEIKKAMNVAIDGILA